MRQVTGDSQDTNLTVSATGQFPSEFAGQVFNITFDAYKEVVVTQAQGPEQGVLVTAADLFSPSIAYAAVPACTVTVPATVAGDGSISAETTLTCGPGYKQVVGIIRTGETGGEECCRGVLDIAGCNPCSTASSSTTTTGPPGCTGCCITLINNTADSIFVHMFTSNNTPVLLGITTANQTEQYTVTPQTFSIILVPGSGFNTKYLTISGGPPIAFAANYTDSNATCGTIYEISE
ncbi:MAG: hypothetical protein D3904_16835 [Candidatus Electrothrix sp. EH2]|nr:hypothetical protein [Candidatus Electrothrix sp. EH2]